MPKNDTVTEQSAEFKALMAVLKSLLRERGLSYRDLAKKLKLSESGVKKIFAGNDCSFQRLGQITKFLNIKLSDLLQEVEEQEMKAVQFSEKQQQVFLKNESAFNFYVKLVIERMSVSEIQQESRLSEAQCFKFLKILDELHLIKLLPAGKVKIPGIALVSDFGAGPLLEKIYVQWGERIVKEVAHPKNQAAGQFIVRCLKMKEETYLEFLGNLRDLERQFAKRALREMAVSTTNLTLTRWMSLTSHGSFVKGSVKQIATHFETP